MYMYNIFSTVLKILFGTVNKAFFKNNLNRPIVIVLHGSVLTFYLVDHVLNIISVYKKQHDQKVTIKVIGVQWIHISAAM